MDVSTTMLRVLREVADVGSFTAAADRLGYTQSAVSRQVAALERQAGTALFERRRDGVRLTAPGLVLLRRARVALDELEAADRDLHGPVPAPEPVRLGVFVSAGAMLLPDIAAAVTRRHPRVALTTREGSSPALVRAVRAGSLDLAVVTTRPPHRALDDEEPRLSAEPLTETALLVAVAADGRFGAQPTLTADDLAAATWIASPSPAGEPLLGVWPGLTGRPHVAHQAGDWLTKLRLVQAGCGITTVPADLRTALPDGVLALPVEGLPAERRRLVLARWPGRQHPAARAVADVVRAVVAQNSSSNPTWPVTPTW